MNKADLLFLFDYSDWANQKLAVAARRLSAEQFTAAQPTTYHSLRGIMVHILVSHQVWLSRCREGRMPAALPVQDEFPDWARFESRLQQEVAAWRAYLETLDEADVQHSVAYTTSRGETFLTPLWQIAVHLVNHTTQHRSEAAEVLTRLGFSPGDLDVIWYLRRAV